MPPPRTNPSPPPQRASSRRSPAHPDPALRELLQPGQSLALLQALHILTRDGGLNQDSRRKLKQVQHLVQFIAPLLHELLALGGPVHVVDHGAGKSYLGFLLYDLVLRQQAQAHVWGVEARAELVDRARTLAAQCGFDRMHFVADRVADVTARGDLPAQVGLVTALHACDTATDDAIAFALAHQAPFIVLVPCCQAELSRHLNAGKARALAAGALAELWRHPLHTREFASHVTNVLRCLHLQQHGYQVQVTELVGWEHSLKNQLIIARRGPGPNHAAARRLRELLDNLGLQALGDLRYPAPAGRVNRPVQPALPAHGPAADSAADSAVPPTAGA